MKWINDYQLFLFDFDGILADTEKLHYKAYLKMCKDRGFTLNWDQRTYVRHALFNPGELKDAIFRELPELKKQEPSWDILYQEKKQAYQDLLQKGVSTVAGVDRLLEALAKADIKRCVVTHSTQEQVRLIRKQNPILETIPTWITREQYTQKKPSPEPYEKAINLLAQPKDLIIGFEDSTWGLKALLGTPAHAFLISPFFDSPEIDAFSKQAERSFTYFPSFEALFKKMASG